MKAIRTRALSATRFKPARMIATDGDGNRAVISADSDAARFDPHDAAATALCRKMNWTGLLHRGWLEGGEYVYVFGNDPENSLEVPGE